MPTFTIGSSDHWRFRRVQQSDRSLELNQMSLPNDYWMCSRLRIAKDIIRGAFQGKLTEDSQSHQAYIKSAAIDKYCCIGKPYFKHVAVNPHENFSPRLSFRISEWVRLDWISSTFLSDLLHGRQRSWADMQSILQTNTGDNLRLGKLFTLETVKASRSSS